MATRAGHADGSDRLRSWEGGRGSRAASPNRPFLPPSSPLLCSRRRRTVTKRFHRFSSLSGQNTLKRPSFRPKFDDSSLNGPKCAKMRIFNVYSYDRNQSRCSPLLPRSGTIQDRTAIDRKVEVPAVANGRKKNKNLVSPI